MDDQFQATNIVVIGATGDLSRRMLLPSLYSLELDKLLPDNFLIVGAARTELTLEEFKSLVRKALSERASEFSEEVWDRFSSRLRYCKLDVECVADFHSLSNLLQRESQQSRHLFFLSLSPNHYITASNNLREAALNTPESRIIVEKPIGHDLKTCRQINASLLSAFDERRIFRIDHYLGKETVQNILALRFANLLFEPLWNRSHIDHVMITVFETVGVEGRWDYYNEYGALRDMIQNHVLQLLCLVAMEPPTQLEPDSVRDEKVKVIRSLRPITASEVQRRSLRGQYADGIVAGKSVPGYSHESGGRVSDTESFVALWAEIDTWRWSGVPFILRTGKRMARRLTEIQIQFRDVPHSVFGQDTSDDLTANRLTITLQPEEHVSLDLMNKTPGLTSNRMRMSPLSLNLSLTDAFGTHRRRIAYEQLLLDALSGIQTLFVRADEVEEAWKWVDGIAEGWRKHAMKPEPYWAGSEGPEGTHKLLNLATKGGTA